MRSCDHDREFCRFIRADAVETAICQTKDGRIVVIHDNNNRRTTGRDATVADLTLAELWPLDAGSWKGPQFAGEKLPTQYLVSYQAPDPQKPNAKTQPTIDEVIAQTQAVRLTGLDLQHTWPLAAGTTEKIPVMLINDYDRPVRGKVALVLADDSGKEPQRLTAPFALDLALPATLGRYRLSAVAHADPGQPAGATISRRKFELVATADVRPIPPLAPAKP